MGLKPCEAFLDAHRQHPSDDGEVGAVLSEERQTVPARGSDLGSIVLQSRHVASRPGALASQGLGPGRTWKQGIAMSKSRTHGSTEGRDLRSGAPFRPSGLGRVPSGSIHHRVDNFLEER